MRSTDGIGLADVREVYDGAEGDLWELLMGHQIHVGGFRASVDLAERAGIHGTGHGVDLCCCTGAGMRFLVRFRGVDSVTGVDATRTVVERGRRRTREEGLEGRVRFVQADVCHSGLPAGEADFVWGEDAWCYVEDKPRLVAEAARLVRPGGTVAFTDWVEGPAGLDEAEARRVLAFMKFPSLASIADYAGLLEKNGCEIAAAEDTGRFGPSLELYRNMVDQQLTGDALRILGYDLGALEAVGEEMQFLAGLADAGKLVQARFIARKP